MGRARLWVWASVGIVTVCSLLAAWARSDRVRRTAQTLECAQRQLDDGKVESAAALLSRITREEPRCVRAHAALAEIRSAQGREAEAMEEYRALIELSPDDLQAYDDLIACALAVGRYSIAEEYLTRRIHDAPHDAYARRVLAFARGRHNRLDKTLAQLESVSKPLLRDEVGAAHYIARIRGRLQQLAEEAGG